MRDNKKEDNRPDSQGRRIEKQTLADVNQWLRPISFIFFRFGFAILIHVISSRTTALICLFCLVVWVSWLLLIVPLSCITPRQFVKTHTLVNSKVYFSNKREKRKRNTEYLLIDKEKMRYLDRKIEVDRYRVRLLKVRDRWMKREREIYRYDSERFSKRATTYQLQELGKAVLWAASPAPRRSTQRRRNCTRA